MSTQNITVTVSNFHRLGSKEPIGTMDFDLSGSCVEKDGTINLRQIHDQADLHFHLDGAEGLNVKWVTRASDAIWLAPFDPKHPDDCPTGPGQALPEFETPDLPAPKLLKLVDHNRPHQPNNRYLYTLRVLVEDEGTWVTCEHDPMIINRIDA
jgi:hypothetical protein